MKVSELIKVLEQCDPNAVVLLDDWNEGYKAPCDHIGVWNKLTGEITISSSDAGLDGFEVLVNETR